MILHFLSELRARWEPLGNLSSLAVRAGLAAVTAFLVAVCMGPSLLRILRSKHYIEDQVHTGSVQLNEINAAKGPTPTMGGLMIVSAVPSEETPAPLETKVFSR